MAIMIGVCALSNKPGEVTTVMVVTESGRRIPTRIANEIAMQENIVDGNLVSEVEFHTLLEEYNPNTWDDEENLFEIE
jgi:hypothetical protein